MKTKQLFLTMLLLFAATANAQTILKGDMNNDKQVTIADVTSLVNVIIGKAPQETINTGGDPYGVDNSLVAGAWMAPDNTLLTLNEDGTTSFSGAATYKFRPVQGVLTFYDASGNPIKAMVLNEVTSDYMMAVDYKSDAFTKYTKLISDGHEFVDLGLPSGTLWATCNVGANSPEEYGNYFAWGETGGYNDGKTTFNWSTYKWCNGSETALTKYCNNSSWGVGGYTDGLTELEPEDDAAYMNWGPNWRIPSFAQLQELFDPGNTHYSMTTQNGVNGYLITSYKNGNSIFLPAAGHYHDSSHTLGGMAGYYWSRTLSTNTPSGALDIYFSSSSFSPSGNARDFGLSVRPVRTTR